MRSATTRTRAQLDKDVTQIPFRPESGFTKEYREPQERQADEESHRKEVFFSALKLAMQETWVEPPTWATSGCLNNFVRFPKGDI